MSPGEVSIPRRPEDTPGDFEALRREGVRRIQELSGELWTDFNPHDPGITILEQLCYGLTDLVHRARFPVRDLLASEDGRIAFEHQALHRPGVALPSRPATLEDLRRLVVDRVPGVEGIWVDLPGAPGGDATSIGVHRVRVHLEGHGGEADAVRAAVLRVLMASRNLGEDLDPEIRVLGGRRCRLRGRVRIRGGRAPEEILAEIHARAGRHVAGEADPATGEFRTMLRRATELEVPGSEGTLESLLTGPWLEGGVAPGSLVGDESRVDVADLVSLALDVEGVAAVEELHLEVEGRSEAGSMPRIVPEQDRVLCLDVPGHGLDGSGIELLRMGRPVAIVEAALRARFAEIHDARRLARRGRAGSAVLPPEPTGANRDDDRYHSIQAHFPAVYGIGDRGLPASASRAERAAMRQLRAYLLPMEQLLASQMSHIRHLRDLFSTADASMPTYRHQVLGDREVPGIEELYRAPPGELLEALFGGADPGGQLRNRVLDHMLALYGESFNQRSLRQFDHYGPERTEEEVLRNKIAYLRSVMTVGRDRGGSFDHTRPYWAGHPGGDAVPGEGNVSGFHLRVGLLLGLRPRGGRSLSGPMTGRGAPEGGEGAGAGEALQEVELQGPLHPVPLAVAVPGIGAGEGRAFLTRAGEGGAASLMVRGVDLEAYGLAPEDGGWTLALRSGEEGRGWRISRHDTREGAVAAANRLRRALVELNLECEGFHVLEHILLRPEGGARDHRGSPQPDGERLWSRFYPLRVSVLFSGWTARASDPRFRLLAEETVRINCPAHIHPECHWLDLAAMQEFEERYGRWLDAKADPGAGAATRDPLAASLVRFVEDRRRGGGKP